MERQQQQQQNGKGNKPHPQASSSDKKMKKIFGSNTLQMSDDGASCLLGSIIEKGISDDPQSKSFAPIPPPKPTVLPFPVARHRSHGPHWGPVGSKLVVRDENNDGKDDEEDKDFKEFEAVATLVKPIKRKEKKSMEFCKWREFVQDDKYFKDGKVEGNTYGLRKFGKQGNGGEAINNVAMDSEKIGSGRTVVDMRFDDSNQLHLHNNGKCGSPVGMESEGEPMSVNSHVGGHDGATMNVLQIGEQKSSDSTMASCSGSNSENRQMLIENEIDVENRARLQGMSPEEIAEAQAEIMDKLDPALLKVLKNRGEGKLKKKRNSSSDIGTNNGPGNVQNMVNNNARTSPLSESDSSQVGMKTTSNDMDSGPDNHVAQNPDIAKTSLWNAWSERVEAVRELRFSLEGNIVENGFVQGLDTGNVTERDFLRTEGDPGSAGYTIKEAVALTRSVIPGQRALALYLLLAVLDKSLYGIHQARLGCTIINSDKYHKFVDWEAIWAYAFGPEPELVLSLRICLDDNHNSVVLACAKVIQCLLSYDMNENLFEFLERLGTLEDVYTAPVFRSKPEIAIGFLHGGFWKYNAKPSNILPLNDNIIDDETDENHTIQDDIVVAGQDFAAGLVRMGILPRIRYLLESDPTAALEECIVSVLIAIARHSPTCATAIMKCQRLVQTLVNRFTAKNSTEIQPAKIKSVCLLKVLARSDRNHCIDLIKNGFFQTMTWHLYQQHATSLDHCVNLGKEKFKLSSALTVEQLRFWKVCIQHGYFVSSFPDIFTCLCLWLNPPAFETLVDNHILREFTSISKEAYLVLEVLARRLPNFFSQKHPSNQFSNYPADDIEIWSWSYVGPVVDLAVKWITSKSDPYACNFYEQQQEIVCDCTTQEPSITSLLWVYSAVMHMLSRVLERIIPDDDAVITLGSGELVPWLPDFVPKIGLEIIRNGFLSFIGASNTEHGMEFSGGDSYFEKLCHLRQHSLYETSLASVSCLRGLLKTMVNIDKLIQLSRKGLHSSYQESSLSREENILKNGIIKGSLSKMKSMQTIFMKLISSECHTLQSIETFGRGGPAPGVGIGWGASGGGYWSSTFLLAQIDSRFLIDLFATFQICSGSNLPTEAEQTITMNMINTSLSLPLTAGPRDRILVEKAFKFMLNVSVLKYLETYIRRIVSCYGKTALFQWEYKDDDYLILSDILACHFRNRWLLSKKAKSTDDKSCIANKPFKKGNSSLDTIHEDLDISNSSQDSNSLVVEWAHQRLPLPTHWFLSPISTLCDSKDLGLQKTTNLENLLQDPGNLIEVAKAGMFFLLGIEAMSTFLPDDVFSPVHCVPLVWKLHALSVVLLFGMDLIDEDKSRDIYITLQDLYGNVIGKARPESDETTQEKNVGLLTEHSATINKDSLALLRFKTEIHESYATFVETLVEQFSSVSYGDVIFGRQVAIYLHRCVEAPIRLAAWNALSNARVLELLPPLETCCGQAEGYLQPVEDNSDILGAYVKSWTSGALDRAATRGSAPYTLVLHHLSSFIFNFCTDDKLLLRNKLVRTLLRDFSTKQDHEVIMLNLIQYNIAPQFTTQEDGSPSKSSIEKRLEVLSKACERNSLLLNEVKKLTSLLKNSSS